MSIERDTPTIGYSGLVFEFKTPHELMDAISAGLEPKITNIATHIKSVEDYGASMTVKAGDTVVEVELEAPEFIWFYMLELFGIEDETYVSEVDYHEGAMALVNNETYRD